MRTVIATILYIIVSSSCIAQPAKVTFRNDSRVDTRMTGSSEFQIFTEKGTYSFIQIKSIAFWEEPPDSTTIQTIRTNGVAVYLKNRRLAPIVKKEVESDYHSVASLGFGAGLDYGGFGFRMTCLPAGPVSFFAGVGTTTKSSGYNFGTEIKFRPHSRSSPFISAMYGYNGAVNSQVFYGFSVGFGLKMRAGKSDKNYFSGGAIFPFREAGFKKAAGDAFAPPVLVSFGFHFGF